MKKEDNNIKKVVDFGSEITGAVAGGVLGTIFVGPAGAALGGISGVALTKFFNYIGGEIVDRHLSSREQVRIGATYTFMLKKIQENQSIGKKLREDGFFKEDMSVRSDAEEIYEGVLIASQHEHEEKKLLYYGNLVGNIAFDSTIDKAQANVLLSLGEQLSYRQLCILNMIVNKTQYSLLTSDYRGRNVNFDMKHIIILQEIVDLYHKNLINVSGEVMFGLTDVNPSKLQVQGAGAMLYNLMELRRITIDDIYDISKYLQELPG